MTDVEPIASPAEAARALFTGEGLPVPPLGAAVTARLGATDDPHVFSTRPDLPASPYNVELFIGELARGKGPSDYAVVGMAGHGFNSWALHYFRVMPGLALLIQIEWGGAYTDQELSREMAALFFAWAQRMQAKAEAAREAGTLPFDRTLLFVVSPFVPSGWAWIEGAPGRGAVKLDGESPIAKRAEEAFDAATAPRS